MNKKIGVLLIGFILGIIWFVNCGFLFIILACVITGYLIWYYAAEEDKKFLVTLFIAGIIMRLLLGSVLHALSVYFSLGYYAPTIPTAFFGSLFQERYAPCIVGDSAVTSLNAWWLSQIWHGKIHIEWLPDKSVVYSSRALGCFYAIFYYLFGFSKLAGKFLNSLFSVGTAVLIYYIAKDIFDRKVAKIAAFLSAFFPSLVLWSVTYLKEPINGFLFCLTIFSVQRFIFSKKARYILFFLISCMSIFIRTQYGIFVITIGLAAIIIILLKKKVVMLTVLTILLCCMIAITPSGREKISLAKIMMESKIVNNVNVLMLMQKGSFTAGAGSSYGIYSEQLESISSVKQLLSPYFIIPVIKGTILFLLTPFPWNISSRLQLISYPQIILWYFLFIFGLFGIMVSLRYKFKRSFFILTLLFLSIVFGGMASGNIGSAMRHRDIVLPIFFVFSSAGLVFLLRKYVKSEY